MHMSKLSTLNFKLSTRGMSRGFTLIETLIAIFILSLAIGALLTLTAGGFFSIRYAKNDIVASNLLQESLEYIRNSRDTAAQQGRNNSNPEITWTQWKQQFSACTNGGVCVINPYPQIASDVVSACDSDDRKNCPSLSYLEEGLYVQSNLSSAFSTSGNQIPTSFIRSITFADVGTATEPELQVSARMDWTNGTNPKHLIQSITLTPWNITP